MRINIEPLRKHEDAAPITFSHSLKPTAELTAAMGAVSVEYITIKGEIARTSVAVTIYYNIEARFETNCARCDKRLTETQLISGEKLLADEGGEEEDDSSFYLIEDGWLAVDEFAEEFLLLELPLRYLCSEDCRGLCVKCGADLNEGECGCPKTEKNPAFKILDDYFKDEQKKK